MKNVRIKYPTYFSEIEDIDNCNIDIFVELKGITFTLTVATPSNYYWYMDKEGIDYIPAGSPDIIVRSMTKENIELALKTYLDDNGYWLKVYILAWSGKGIFKMNKMIEDKKKEFKDIL